jgi:hypothetical protein
MENNEQKIREDLVQFIRKNDKTLTPEELDGYSITALTILKTALEIKLSYSKSKRTKK